MEENNGNRKELLDEQYIEMALERYEKIKSVVSKRKRPTRYNKELISLIFNKMVDPYYYWAEDRVKGETKMPTIKKRRNRALTIFPNW